ncbi:MAG: DNA-binding protein [Elusimicrobia bacterium GWA2_61_42]|nr:MAG: DNA-binding protein [Elusimicrobia bacterium GWA2_61_42]OGR75751.1 MAG: DNA-binding protein [Elusimicrobia bacterium GWC2_61_25]
MSKEIVPQEFIASKIYIVRGHKVMLDSDLASLYGVTTKSLNQAVSRNLDSFPPDFMYKLKASEQENLRFQIGTSRWGGRRYLPYVFTHNGVSMLSSVLKSKRARQVNIQIMRTFTKLKELLDTHADLRRKLEEMEKKYDHQFKVVFDAIKSLLSTPDEPVRKIGFTAKS